MATPQEKIDNAKSRFWRVKGSSGWSAKRSLALLAGLVALLFFLSPLLLGENGLPTYSRLHAERNSRQREVEQLRQQTADLAKQIEELDHDPETLETLAREGFNMHLRNEDVIEVVDEGIPVPPP